MFQNLIEFQSLKALTTDGRLLFGTRTVRLFAYGFLSVILALYLTQLGLTDQQIGLLLTLTLVGDAIISLWMAAVADRIGRRRMLILGAGLMIFAGLVFALTRNMILLTLAAIIGTISPSGSEVGPFLSIEQAALPQTVPNKYRTQIFAWYNLIGSFATALGSFNAGLLVEILQHRGTTPLNSYRAVVMGYALLGIALGLLFAKLSPGVEVEQTQLQGSGEKATAYHFGLHRSRKVVLKLSLLFMLDSFAGSLVVQSLIAYWFHIRFGVEPAILGSIFFGANIFAGLSALVAARIASRFGLINTMVFTHIPSNILLILVPLMPDLTSAIIVLLLRFSISQMDVPTRQSYTMAVVDPDERSAAAGVTSIARTAASSIGPVITGALLGASWLNLPFFLAGSLKIIYDLTLYHNFRNLKPPEES
ncbi:MAG TPA: MFS transporter [Candidatus Limnocylindrales bacterium]|nr:MFS transporter [Candidatus Limnocylindrales bacterium]